MTTLVTDEDFLKNFSTASDEGADEEGGQGTVDYEVSGDDYGAEEGEEERDDEEYAFEREDGKLDIT